MTTSADEVPKGGAPRPPGSSAWAPFRSRDFARMASAQFVSNVGGWMQTVGAQELMLTLTTSATLVALIQTAAGLPIVLFAVPAGALGDLVDRRRLLIASQAFMLVAAAALAALAFAGLVTPPVLLGLIFAVGAGQTLTSPTWQTLQPELVAPEDRTQAIALGAVNQNLSRAIGPAIGGALYAATSAGALFLVNALSFVPVIGAVARWRGRAHAATATPPEHVGQALRAGARYVAASPALRVILLRAGLFMLFANSIWALLPLVAHARLHLGSGGYGLLLGGVGIGAVAGAVALPRIRGRVGVPVLMTSTMLTLAAVTAALAYARTVALAAAAVLVAGVAWILILSTFNSQYQGTLPGWAKARGMSYYLGVVVDERAIAVRYRLLSAQGVLDERTRRLWAAGEARAAGYGGLAAVVRATGISESRVLRGLADLGSGEQPAAGKLCRHPGRTPILERAAGLGEDLERLVDPVTGGDPESPLRWASKSAAKLAEALRELGHDVVDRAVLRLVKAKGYSVEANKRTREGAQDPDRDAQFEHVSRTVGEAIAAGQPVISVDAKKRELIGGFKAVGREVEPTGRPVEVRGHDFKDKQLGHAIPYGVYDLMADEGWVSVAITGDTAEFAVHTIVSWWGHLGRVGYPAARTLTITADSGGSTPPAPVCGGASCSA